MRPAPSIKTYLTRGTMFFVATLVLAVVVFLYIQYVINQSTNNADSRAVKVEAPTALIMNEESVNATQ